MKPLPPLDLLNPPVPDPTPPDEGMGEKLVAALQSFNVEGTLVGTIAGPTITRFEIKPGDGVKIREVTVLVEDLALAMKATSVRIIAPVPGRGVIGIEVPNTTPSIVPLSQILSNPAYSESEIHLPIGLGVTLEGFPVITDLTTMPHLLVAGTTGSGKSVCLNGIVLSLILKNTPDTLRMIMIDPKMVELSVYNGLPHLRHEVITHHLEASAALAWAIEEMETRYLLLSMHHCRNIEEFNSGIKWTTLGKEVLPYIIIIIDELADLMMVSAKEFEDKITRLAQKARAVGIHLVIATQRPSVDVVTGLIKANFPSRIAFRVFSSMDSRVILDQSGAEKLIGNGDMLLTRTSNPALLRIQGAFVSTEEAIRVVDWYKKNYPNPPEESDILESRTGGGDPRDPLFKKAAESAINQGRCSAELLMISFEIGFSRANKLLDQLTQNNVISTTAEDGYHRVLVDRQALKDL